MVKETYGERVVMKVNIVSDFFLKKVFTTKLTLLLYSNLKNQDPKIVFYPMHVLSEITFSFQQSRCYDEKLQLESVVMHIFHIISIHQFVLSYEFDVGRGL